MNKKDRRRIRGAIRRLGVFTGNLLIGTVMYLIVLLLVSASGLVVDWVATWCNDTFMLATMRIIGNMLMVLDGVLLVWTAFWSTVKAFKA